MSHHCPVKHNKQTKTICIFKPGVMHQTDQHFSNDDDDDDDSDDGNVLPHLSTQATH